MRLPGWRDWAFSAKTFGAAMLALFLAFSLDLQRPYWAMATAYIVAEPMTGMLRSKAAYRFAGTLIGAIVTLALVPNLVNAPELLVAALAVWIGCCIYFGVLDRTPRSYLFLLAGYTTALIGFPAVDTPDAIWDIVLGRVEEITLGIFCTTLVSTTLLPVPLGPALAARIDSLMDQAAAAAMALLSGLPDSSAAIAARRALAADAVQVAGLSSHLGYDVSAYATARPAVNIIYQRITLLLAVLSGLADRIAALRDIGGLTPELRALLEGMSAWIAARDHLVDGAAARHAELDALMPKPGQQPDWTSVLQGGLLMRLHELTDLAHDLSALRRQLDSGRQRLPPLSLPAAAMPRHRDHLMAAYSAVAAIVAIAMTCAFWIATAWPDGAGAAGLTAVVCCFFAAQDDPVPSILRFMFGAVLAAIIDAAYLFAILPPAHDFGMLALALAPLYLVLGVLMARPKTAALAKPIAFMTATLMALTSNYSAEFASYVNGTAAILFGLAAAAVVLRLTRSVGAGWAAQRLLWANRADIAAAASRAGANDRLAFSALTLDRLAELVPRLAATAQGAEGPARAALAEIRVGINVVDLQRTAPACAAAQSAALRAVLDGVAVHFSRRATEASDGTLLSRIDAAIEACGAPDVAHRRDILLALGGIRRALFPDAPAYLPAPPPPPALAIAA
jgi:uncharacterized membrane protein YccC